MKVSIFLFIAYLNAFALTCGGERNLVSAMPLQGDKEMAKLTDQVNRLDQLNCSQQLRTTLIEEISPAFLATNQRVNAIVDSLLDKAGSPLLPPQEPFDFDAERAALALIADGLFGEFRCEPEEQRRVDYSLNDVDLTASPSQGINKDAINLGGGMSALNDCSSSSSPILLSLEQTGRNWRDKTMGFLESDHARFTDGLTLEGKWIEKYTQHRDDALSGKAVSIQEYSGPAEALQMMQGPVIQKIAQNYRYFNMSYLMDLRDRKLVILVSRADGMASFPAESAEELADILISEVCK